MSPVEDIRPRSQSQVVKPVERTEFFAIVNLRMQNQQRRLKPLLSVRGVDKLHNPHFSKGKALLPTSVCAVGSAADVTKEVYLVNVLITKTCAKPAARVAWEKRAYPPLLGPKLNLMLLGSQRSLMDVVWDLLLRISCSISATYAGGNARDVRSLVLRVSAFLG